MTPTPIPNQDPTIFGTSLLFIYKILLLTGLFVYILFALILVQQIKAKRDTIRTPLGAILELLGVIHLILAVLLFALALFIL